MTKRSMRLYSAAALIAIFAGALSSCKNPAQDIKVAIATSTLNKTALLIKFTKANADAGSALPAAIPVTAGGQGASFVQTDAGNNKFVAANGMLSLSLNRLSTPSVSNPVEFTIAANVEGYAPVFYKFVITDSKLEQVLEIPLLSYTAPADGTSVSVDTKPLTAGVATAATAIDLPATAKTPQSVEVVMPAGTQMLDANKQAINATSLKSTVVYYGTSDEDAYRAYEPNLMATTNVIGQDKKPVTEPLVFITAGVVSINMTAGSTAVKNFSKPVAAELEINPELVNPITGNKVQAGEAIPIWSRNEETGQWTYERTANIVRNPDGKLAVKFEMTHLSAWGPMWPIKICKTGAFNPISMNFGYLPSSSSPPTVRLMTPTGQLLTPPTPIAIAPGQSGALILGQPFNFTFPEVKNAIVVVTNSLSNSHLASAPLPDICGGAAFTMQVPLPATFATEVDTEINFTAICTNKNIVAYPTTWVRVTDVSAISSLGTSTLDIHMKDGKLGLRLRDGGSYTVSTTYDGKLYTSAPIKIDTFRGVDVKNTSGLTVKGSVFGKVMKLDASFSSGTCK